MGSASDSVESIHVENLTKRYGRVVAIDSISFSTRPGEVVGFLGPNGAGKTTTMRILTCFMPASEGVARVAGHDVFRESDAVRRRIGYLPENVPLYPEMRVNEYLDFRAAIKMRGVRRPERRRRISWAVGQCRLEDVRTRIIGQLSKGYRQRVGLADSLVHDPEVLILDEPTVGLDPNQTRDVRELVKGLARSGTEGGRERTVLFSTHIIPWVERVCERVIVIDRGRLVADGDAAELLGRLRDVLKLRIRVEGDAAPIVDGLRGASEVSSVDNYSIGDDQAMAMVFGPRDREDALRAAIDRVARERGGRVVEIETEPVGLEDVFRALTHGIEEPAVESGPSGPEDRDVAEVTP